MNKIVTFFNQAVHRAPPAASPRENPFQSTGSVHRVCTVCAPLCTAVHRVTRKSLCFLVGQARICTYSRERPVSHRCKLRGKKGPQLDATRDRARVLPVHVCTYSGRFPDYCRAPLTRGSAYFLECFSKLAQARQRSTNRLPHPKIVIGQHFSGFQQSSDFTRSLQQSCQSSSRPSQTPFSPRLRNGTSFIFVSSFQTGK